MNEFDRTLIETTKTHRERLASAFIHGRLTERHKVNTNLSRRAVLVRALATEPQLLVCDEVTTALDHEIAAIVLDCIRDWQQTSGSAVLLISHLLGPLVSMAQS